MLPSNLLFFTSKIILLCLGIAVAQKMNLDQPLSPKLQLSDVQKNTSVTAVNEINFQTIKVVRPSIHNHNIENRTSQEINFNKVTEILDNFEDIFIEKGDNSLLYHLKQNKSATLTNLNSTEKDIVMNHTALVALKNTTIERETLTFNDESDDINDGTTENPRFQQPANIIKDSKKILIPLNPSVKSSTNNRINKNNKSRSYKSKFLNIDAQQRSNVSFVDKSQSDMGDYTQNTFEVRTEYPEESNRTMAEEAKLNKKYKELPSSKNISKSNMSSGNVTKINEFTKAKLLMIDYFESLNIKQVSIKDTIMSSQNMFELMEKSSKLIREILEARHAREEHSYFVKNIMERQIEKCEGNYSLTKSNINGTIPTHAKIENNERLMNFIKCVNINLQNCIINFDVWLRTGKFYLRPHFNLTRAYKSYERIYFLNCE